MNKLTKIVVAILIVLLVIVIIIFLFNYRKELKETLYILFTSAEQKIELNSKSEKIEMHNMTNSYDIEFNSQEINNNPTNTNLQKKEYNQNPENVEVEILEETITPNGITIVITDNNEDSYTWGENYKIEHRQEEQWIELKPNERIIFNAIAYNKDQNNQITFNINWNSYYGELENGIYRIVKPVYDINNDEYINIYSNEFEIEK